MPMLTKSRKSRPTNTQTSTISNVLSDSTTNMSDRNNGTTTKRTRTVISQPNVDSENESDDEGRQHKRKRGKQIHSDDDEDVGFENNLSNQHVRSQNMEEVESLEKTNIVEDHIESQFTSGLKERINMEVDVASTIDGDPGHIMQISLENFMCHENFSLSFSPRINFIIGQNGSGKSAIASALVLALGARATTTNRGSGLASFIRTGQTRAKITVTICNYLNASNKSGSYRPEIFGPKITIERVIYRTGSSSYKVRSSADKVISEKKEEVDNIVKFFQIVVDNPLTVLTQEVSKNFLNSKDPKDKFKFFVKATQLEDIKNDYEHAFDNVRKSIEVMNSKKDSIDYVEKNLKELEKKVKIIEIIRNNAKKLHDLVNEGFWARHNEKKRDINELMLEKEELEKKIKKCSEEIESAKKEVEEAQDEKTDFEKKFQKIDSIIEQSRVELSTASQNLDNAKKFLANKTAEMKARQYEINCFNKNISDLQKRIQGIEIQLDGTSSIDFESEIARITDEIESLKKMDSELTEKAVKLEGDDDYLKANSEKLINEERNLRATINAHTSEIDRLKRGQTNRYARYGFNMEELVKHVNGQINRFKKRPYGPLGDYIRLSDSNAAYASECLLKDNLNAFVVDNYDDYAKLKELFTKVLRNNRQPSIIIRKYVPLHDISRFEARSNKYKNFFQLLNIAQPEVANCLIDHCKIERIVFIPDYDEAMSVLLDEDSVPQNCGSAYTKDGDLMFPTTSNQDFRSYPDNGHKIPRVLVSDSRSAIEVHKQEIEKSKQSLVENVQKLKDIRSKIDNNRREKLKIDESIFDAKSSISEKVRKLKDLKQKSTLQPVAVITLKEEIQELEREKKAIQEQIDDEREICDEAKVEYAKALKEMDEKTEKLNINLNSRNSFNSESNAIQTKIEKKKSIVHANNIQMKEYEKMVKSFEHDLSEEENLLNEYRKIALEKCEEEIETNRSYASIIEEARKINSLIENNQDLNDSEKQKEVIAKYGDLSKLVHKSKSEMSQLRNLFNELDVALHQRKIAYHNLRFYVVEIVNYYFRMVLNQRNFDGHINVNYFDVPSDENDSSSARKKKGKAKTLDVVIYPRNRKQFESHVEGDDDISLTNIDNPSQVASTMYSSTKSLSGGERSYSTVAFIIALWQMNRSPFKLLDEIDVFMDMVTRKISIDMLVAFATKRSTKQFIFLSPLKLQHIEYPEVVQVLQMPEIKRK